MMIQFRLGLAFTIIAIMAALPFPANAREFINNFMNINVGVSYGFTSGGILKSEEKFPFIVPSLPYAQVVYPTHYAVSYTLGVDFLPIPAFILGDESHAFKVGIRTGYRFDIIRQRLEFKRIGQSTWRTSGNLIKAQNWMAGPVIRYAPFIKYDPITGQYGSRWGFLFFATGGTFTSGKYESRTGRLAYINMGTAYIYRIYNETAALNFLIQEAQGMLLFRSTFKGHRIDAGMGIECAIFYINLGINCYYSRIVMKMDEPLFGKFSEHYDQVSIEGYLSIPIEWSFLPRTF